MSSVVVNQAWIEIEGLELDASIGVYDWEKQTRQKLIFDLSLAYDIDKATQSDHVDDVVDYALVAEQVEKLVHAKHYDLIEFLGAQVIDTIFEMFPVEHIRLKLSKPAAIPKARNTAIVIERSR